MAEGRQNNYPNVNVTETMRVNNQAWLHGGKPKTSSFQITSVTDQAGSRLSNDGGEDSADDLEDSRTEDVTDSILTRSNQVFHPSDDKCSKTEEVFVTNAIPSPIIPTAGGQYGIAIVTTEERNLAAPFEDKITDTVITVAGPSSSDSLDELQVWKNKFKIVKIQRTDPYKRGRWECMDFLDQPANNNVLSTSPPPNVVSFISDVQSKIDAGTVTVYSCADSTTSLATETAPPIDKVENTAIDANVKFQNQPFPYQTQTSAQIPTSVGQAPTKSIPLQTHQQPAPPHQQMPIHHQSSPVPHPQPAPLHTQTNVQILQQTPIQHPQPTPNQQTPSIPKQATTLSQATPAPQQLLQQATPIPQQTATQQPHPQVQQQTAAVSPHTLGVPTSLVQTNHIPVDHGITVTAAVSVNLPTISMNLTNSQPIAAVHPYAKTNSMTSAESVMDFSGTDSLLTETLAEVGLVNAVENTPAQEETESASGTSTVAIDNKIEQAMDLVKSHLMFAVREEVDVLKERIHELMDKISQLEYENSILRAHASQETLAQLGNRNS